MKAGRLSLATLTHQKAPKKKKPRAASDTRGFYRTGAHPLMQGGVGCASIKPTICEWVPKRRTLLEGD